MTATRAETLLSVNGVGLSFGKHVVLRDVTVRIDNLARDSGETTGQIVAFLGPSGSGKTQLLRILAGLQRPTTGYVRVGEKQEFVRPGMVGMVSQQYCLYRNRTVAGNLMVAAMQHDPAKWRTYLDLRKRTMLRCMDVLERFGLAGYQDLYPSQLSGGQRQRVAIAQQLLCSEHFILLDEPTTGLDPISKASVCKLVMEVANQDDLNTVILVTHDIPTAVSLADTIWLMGRDRSPGGGLVPGSRIVETYDLIDRGLCWHENIQRCPEFATMVREIEDRFLCL